MGFESKRKVVDEVEQPKRKSKFKLILSIFWIILKVIILIILLAVIGIGAYVVYKYYPTFAKYNSEALQIINNSTVDDFKLSESSYIYDSKGKQLAKLCANQDSEYLVYEDIPAQVVSAFIAIEDRTFWENPGIDTKGLARVAIQAVKTKGAEVHGASTISQQLVKNVYLTNEKTLERKAKEALISIYLNKKYTKKQIIEFYINDIYYANNYYGISAAAHGYFNKEISECTLSEMVYLCAIPNRPSYYDPIAHPENALKRRNKILGDMRELGYISPSQYAEAINEEITITPPKKTFNNYQTSYAIDCATRYLMKLDGFTFEYSFATDEYYNAYKEKYAEEYELMNRTLYSNGYKIYTSLDSEVQDKVQQHLDEGLADNQEKSDSGIYAFQGAVTVIDNKTNKVLAVVGGRSQEELNTGVYTLNRAYQAYRQPGSSIKPLVTYTPALQIGYTPSSIVKNINVTEAKKPGTDITKLSGKQMTLRSALEQSKNGVSWLLLSEIKPKAGLKNLTDMEFNSIVPGDYNLAASLGGLTYGATTVEMAGAYNCLVNKGHFNEPTCLVSIKDTNGHELYKRANEKIIYTEFASCEMVDMMRGVLTVGTAKSLKWYDSTQVEAACKTGTTNDSKDGWLCGFTPDYTVTVWVGYDTPKPLGSLYGSTYPGQIWKATMLDLLGDKKEDKFDLSNSQEDDSEVDKTDEYYSYLPGRDDNEVLSKGYTVRNYREDRCIGSQVYSLMELMRNTPVGERKELQTQAEELLKTIVSQKYKKEVTSAFNSLLKKLDALDSTDAKSEDGKTDSTSEDTSEEKSLAETDSTSEEEKSSKDSKPKKDTKEDKKEDVTEEDSSDSTKVDESATENTSNKEEDTEAVIIEHHDSEQPSEQSSEEVQTPATEETQESNPQDVGGNDEVNQPQVEDIQPEEQIEPVE